MFSSCDAPVTNKALVIKNDSGDEIYHVSIIQIISGAKSLPPNALAEGETIGVGERKTFYLAPYSKGMVNTIIATDNSYSHCDFTYKYLVNNKNEAVRATFNADGTITLDGSEAEAHEPS